MPTSFIQAFHIRAVTPDNLMCQIYRHNPETTMPAIKELLNTKHNPPMDILDFANRLKRAGANGFANNLVLHQ